MRGHAVAVVTGGGRDRVLVLLTAERVVQALVWDDLVQRRQRRAGGERATQEAAATQPQRAVPIRVGCRPFGGGVILSIVHNRDFDRSKRSCRPCLESGW